MSAKEINLSEKQVKPVVDMLNEYLANYHIHYQKLRGCHWNIKGQNFFTLHITTSNKYKNTNEENKLESLLIGSIELFNRLLFQSEVHHAC